MKFSQKTIYIITGLVIASGLILKINSSPKTTQIKTIKQPPTSSVPSAAKNKQADQVDVRQVKVIAKQFEFSPNPIRVRLGERVKLLITTSDITHGFSLPELGINEIINPGQTTTIEFQASKKGEFSFACSVQCGIGHANMRGVLIVE